MLALFIVTCSMALVAPVIQSIAWRVPFGQLSIAMVLRAMLGAGASTVLAGALAAGCLSFFPAPAEQASWLAAGFGGTFGLSLVVLTSTRLRKFRGILLLAHRVREPGGRAQALELLRRNLQHEKEHGPPSTYAKMVLLVIAPLTHANLWQEAENLLSELDTSTLDDRQRGLRAQGLATCRLQLGDIGGAADALASVGDETDAATERWLQTTRALITVLRGNADEALCAVGDPLDETETVLRASKQIVCAHAYAALGRVDEAKQALSEVIDEVGPAGLDRAIHPEGPATALAKEMRTPRLRSATS